MIMFTEATDTLCRPLSQKTSEASAKMEMNSPEEFMSLEEKEEEEEEGMGKVNEILSLIQICE